MHSRYRWEWSDRICLCLTGFTRWNQAKLLYVILILQRLNIRKRSKAGMSHIPEDRHKHGLVLDYTLEDNMVLQRYWEPRVSEERLYKKT